MDEFKINITADDGVVINAEKVFDITIDREETAKVEEAIIELEKEIAEKTAKLEDLKNKIAFNKYVIEIADKIKAEKEAEVIEETTEFVEE